MFVKLNRVSPAKDTRRQILSSSIVLLTSFVYGCKVGFVQAVTPLFASDRSPFEVTTEDISWLGSISYTGTLISVVLCYTFSGKVSRRAFIFCCISAFTICWLIILITSSIRIIIGCFFIYGVAASMLVITGNTYFSEIASPKNRELLGIMYSLATQIGIETTYPLIIFNNHKIVAVFPFIICILAVSSLYFMKESPYFLISKGLVDEAEVNYRWLNYKIDEENVDEDIENIRKFISEQEGNDLNKLKTIMLPVNLKLVSVLLIINSLLGVSTITVLAMYGPKLIESLDYAVNNRSFFTIYNTSALASQILAILTTRSLNRRPQIMYGFLARAALQLLCGLLLYFHWKSGPEGNRPVAFMIAIILITSLISDTLFTEPGMAILKFEILPHRLKEFYTSVFAFTSDVTNFVVVRTFFSLYDTKIVHILPILYACFSTVPFFIIMLCIPNTKNKTLYQIRENFSVKKDELEMI